jgi:hypothetical protein
MPVRMVSYTTGPALLQHFTGDLPVLYQVLTILFYVDFNKQTL